MLMLSDGGTVSLHWADPPTNPSNRVVLVLPGLNNDSKTSFVQATLSHLSDNGFHAVALNYRGTGGLPLTSPKMGGGDTWHDFNHVLDHIQTARPGAHMFAIGFSMGAMNLLKFLGEEGDQVRLRGAVAIAAPVDAGAIARSLESSLKKCTTNFVMTSGAKLLVLLPLLNSEFIKCIELGRALRARSMRQLEEATICLMNGYKNADEYYDMNSPRPLLQRIAVPTLIVNAEDDPVVSVTTLPLEELRANPFIYTVLTRRGGHIAWGSGGYGSASWTDSIARRFLQLCTSWISGQVGRHSRL